MMIPIDHALHTADLVTVERGTGPSSGVGRIGRCR